MTPQYRLLTLADAKAAYAIEATSYPEDEAASLMQIQNRLKVAGEYFLGVFYDEILVGFVNGTLTSHRELDEETMSSHDPSGKYLCIHSVVVINGHRRQRIATNLLKMYVKRILEEHTDILAMLLIAKPYLVKFYINCGFCVTRLSPVVHGQDAWMELILDCIEERKLQVVQVDAFASKPYEGNPAAVVVMSSREFHAPGVATWMQQCALERNLSETAFVCRLDGAPNEYQLRWFTPGCEVNLCGHATLATAFTLYEDGHSPKDATIRFHTKSGVLTSQYVSQSREGKDKCNLIEIDLPAQTKQEGTVVLTQQTLSRLANCFAVPEGQVIAAEKVGEDMIFHVTDTAFANIIPDMSLIGAIDCRGVIVTCQGAASDRYDFYSRFFAPRCGILEDPVTGSAHCALGPYWSRYFPRKCTFMARQASPRGGDVVVRLEKKTNRVYLRGGAVFTMRGKLL